MFKKIVLVICGSTLLALCAIFCGSIILKTTKDAQAFVKKPPQDPPATPIYQIEIFSSQAALSSKEGLRKIEAEMNKWFAENSGVKFISASIYHGMYDSKAIVVRYQTDAGEKIYNVKLFYCQDIVGNHSFQNKFKDGENAWLKENSGKSWVNKYDVQNSNWHALDLIVYQE